VVSAVTNASVNSQSFFPSAQFDYCSVTFAYSHNGLNDLVHVKYWVPSPEKFQNRYLSTGGGGFSISSGSGSLPGGIIYGAVAGTTDGGFGSFSTQSDAVFLVNNGTVNLKSLYMFGYEAHHELSLIGKAFTKQFFNMSSTKLYSYYQGCSEGGREGWSQVQRYGDEWDGAITGAPAFRFSHQQGMH
jgi:tannase